MSEKQNFDPNQRSGEQFLAGLDANKANRQAREAARNGTVEPVTDISHLIEAGYSGETSLDKKDKKSLIKFGAKVVGMGGVSLLAGSLLAGPDTDHMRPPEGAPQFGETAPEHEDVELGPATVIEVKGGDPSEGTPIEVHQQ